MSEIGDVHEMEEPTHISDPATTGFLCIICHKQFLQEDDVSSHELKEHFSWAIKPYNLSLLRTLIKIIREDSINYTNFDLKVQLELALVDFETNYDRDVRCLECDYSTRKRNELIKHFKIHHIFSRDDDEEEETTQDSSPFEPCSQSSTAGILPVWSAPDQSPEEESENVERDDDDLKNYDVGPDENPLRLDGVASCHTEEDENFEETSIPHNGAEKHDENGQNGQDSSDFSDQSMDESENGTGQGEKVDNARFVTNKPTEEKGPSQPDTDEDVTLGRDEKSGSGRKKLIFDCGFCGQIFSGTRALDRHAMVVHFKDSKCQICGLRPEGLARRDYPLWMPTKTMKKHMRSAHKLTLCGKEGLPCPDCDYLGLTVAQLCNHRSINHQGSDENLRCFPCQRSFRTEHSLRQHRLAQHTSSARYACKRCPGVPIPTEKALSRHLSRSVKHADLCEKCGLPQSQADNHECPAQLGKGVEDNLQKKAKFKSIAGKDGTGYLCQSCTYTCSKRYTMMRHIALMHHEQSCPHPACDHVANNRIGLHRHIREQHRDMCHMCAYIQQDEVPHECAERLLVPKKGHHRFSDLSSNPMLSAIKHEARPGACERCGIIFLNSISLRRHLKMFCQ